MNILVIPSGTEVAHEIVRSLVGVKNINVYGANSVDSYTEIDKENITIGIPYINDNNFIPSIIEICKLNNITHIFPAHDDASLKLTKNQHQLNAKVVSSCYKTNEICRSKRKTYQLLKDIIRVPMIYDFRSQDLEFPLFSKPDTGQGSVGVKKIENIKDLDLVTDSDILCEYLPGNEYTVDCVTDSFGELIFAGARLRRSTRNGIAVETELVDDNEQFFTFAYSINKKLNLRGAWFFQVKEDKNGDLCLLEVATRIAGSMITNRFVGINFSELSILISNNIPVSVLQQNFKVKLFRNLAFQFQVDLKFDHIYTDFDDCLIFEDKVNSELVSFLYNELNNHKKITLITRHSGDLNKKLKELRLYALFDEIIHITNGDKKSNYILNANSIFIDDSFSERKDVSDSLGIPCFSVDMIRGLNCRTK
ncbi:MULTISPECIES: ATP-grasp domain-containing protein [Vibrio]|uniref:ATP-grasp domain-containing protein n=1 Tax=Vibrio TaxID=662 RepID=UPI000B5CCC9E|nr:MULTISPECIES: ATP-grasp domain-containing protein [Vibrio]HBV76739.1 hypothetical protein [Vibrio sp.]